MKLDGSLRFDFNTIYVIESLDKGDRKTGRALHDDLLRWKSEQIKHLDAQYEEVNSKEQLVKTLDLIRNDVEKKGVFPIIHFEIHGDKEGVGLNNGENLSWDELAALLRKINVAAKHNVLVTFATCFGANFLGSLDITKMAPCWGLIGPWDYTGVQELEMSFFGFYERLLIDGNVNEALKAFDDTMKNGGNYKFYPAEMVFEIAVEGYKRSNKDDGKLRKRLENLFVEALARGLVNESQKESWIAARRRIVLDDGSFYERMKMNFLMK